VANTENKRVRCGEYIMLCVVSFQTVVVGSSFWQLECTFVDRCRCGEMAIIETLTQKKITVQGIKVPVVYREPLAKVRLYS